MSETRASPDDFAATFEAALSRLRIAIADACEREATWPAGVAAAIGAAFEFAAADPEAAQVLANEALACGAEGIAGHERLIAGLAAGLRPGRDERPDGECLPDVTERAMAGGIVMLVAQRLDQGREDELPDLAPEAVQFVLTPYLGAAEAMKISEAMPCRSDLGN